MIMTSDLRTELNLNWKEIIEWAVWESVWGHRISRLPDAYAPRVYRLQFDGEIVGDFSTLHDAVEFVMKA